MKKYFISLFLVFGWGAGIQAQRIHIPDEVFKTFLVEHFDSDGDGAISEIEAKAVTRMKFSTEKISSIEGIEYFTSLEELDCTPSNPFGKGLLTSFDISRNTSPKKLYCYNNQLDTLDLGSNMSLTDVNCRNNRIKTLDVSHNPMLEELICDNNKIDSLDVSWCGALTYLNCSRN